MKKIQNFINQLRINKKNELTEKIIENEETNDITSQIDEFDININDLTSEENTEKTSQFINNDTGCDLQNESQNVNTEKNTQCTNVNNSNDEQPISNEEEMTLINLDDNDVDQSKTQSLTNIGYLIVRCKSVIYNNSFLNFLSKHKLMIGNALSWIILLLILIFTLIVIYFNVHSTKVDIMYPPLPHHPYSPLNITSENENEKIFQFFTFSDPHIDIEFHKTGSLGRNYSLGKMGNDPPPSLLKSTLLAMKRMNPNPSFIVFLGDVVRHKKLKESKFKQSFSLFQSYVSEIFPSTLILPVIGNHDVYPNKDYLEIKENSGMLNFIADTWSNWLPESAIKSVKKGGYYAVDIPNSNIKFVAINTLIYTDDWMNECTDLLSIDACNQQQYQSNNDPFFQFAFINNEFEKARNLNQKVIIISHVGIGLSRSHKSQMSASYQLRLNTLFANNVDVIASFISGHSHRDIFNTFVEPTSSSFSGIPMFASTAITPVDNSNPSFRLNYVSSESAEILDYQHVSFNLNNFVDFSDLMIDDHEFWEVEYVFKSEYFVSPNQRGISKLFENLYYHFSNPQIFDFDDDDGEDETLIEQYFEKIHFVPQMNGNEIIDVWEKMKYFYTSYYPTKYSHSDEIKLFCAYLYFDVSQYNRCVKQFKDKTKN